MKPTADSLFSRIIRTMSSVLFRAERERRVSKSEPKMWTELVLHAASPTVANADRCGPPALALVDYQ